VVTRLGRLARSAPHLCQIVEILSRKQGRFQVFDQNLDTSDATERVPLHIWAMRADSGSKILAATVYVGRESP
jgi:DNA invertase Pin-like site-specific DNA recombinase